MKFLVAPAFLEDADNHKIIVGFFAAVLVLQ